jgi:hypothetical protein
VIQYQIASIPHSLNSYLVVCVSVLKNKKANSLQKFTEVDESFAVVHVHMYSTTISTEVSWKVH